jgi:hypothetical protein
MLSVIELCPLPDLRERGAEDAPSISTAESTPHSTSSRNALFFTPTPSKARSSITPRHLQEALLEELHTYKQQLEACKQQLESANTRAAVAEAAAEAAEAAAAGHKARAAELHNKNIRLEAQLKSAQRAQAASQRAMAAIRSAVEWAERPLDSRPTEQQPEQHSPPK